MRNDSSGAYGQTYILKRYLELSSIPSGVVIQHGWTPLNNVLKSDLFSSTHLMLSWSKRYQQEWVKQSNVPCEVLGAPFVHYRRMNKTERLKNANGTLAFPAHSTKEIEAKFDLQKYCNELHNLPDKFKPVTICLHHLDIMYYGMKEAFQDQGFNVVCISRNKKTSPYVLFYDLIKNFKYTTSNEPGSYTFYSVEMNIPFFILGDMPIRHNHGAKNTDIMQSKYTMQDFQYGSIAYDLFSDSSKDRITKEQKDFVLEETGMTDPTPKDALIKKINEIIILSKNDKNNPLETKYGNIWKAIRNPFLVIEYIRDTYLDRKYFG